MTMRRTLAVLAALLAFAGCSKDKEVAPPAELVDIETTLRVRQLWSTGLGGGAEDLRLALGLAGDAETVYAASRDGDLRALDAGNGRTRWRTKVDLALASGPGFGSGKVAVGTNEGDVVAFEAATGKRLWRAKVGGEVLATPLVTADRVVVRTVDGRLRSLAAQDGKEQWVIEELVPRLSLRGTSAPVLAGGSVICGFDNGKVIAVAIESGEILWQSQVSTARGRSELERLSDVDSEVRVSGADVYAVGYQGRAAMLGLDNGQVWWARDLSSYRGLAIDDDQVYVATSDGDVVALRRRDGSVVWQQEALKRRGLGTPAVFGNTVVVGDYDGYLHWLDRGTGKFVAREHPGGARISAAPLVTGGRIVVMDENGKVVAYRSGDAAGS
ncbi:MAG: outer membrane protein assembly factor BamB [Steroidobacteraceae bacterium]